MIAGLMRNTGWQSTTQDSVRRIWREEGLKMLAQQNPRGRLWLNDGSRIRLRPERRNHVWSHDSVLIRDTYGRKIQTGTTSESSINPRRGCTSLFLSDFSCIFAYGEKGVVLFFKKWSLAVVGNSQ
jgi:hypothetical protein